MRISILRRFHLLAAAVLVTSTATYAEVEQRTVNNGNVILENVPEIPDNLKERLNRYLNTRSAGFRDWTEDGTGIYITTRFGNVSQIHKVASPGAARTQLTFFDEPIGGVERRPGSASLTFTMDAGGNEFSQIFLLDPRSGNHTLLSDGESRNGAVSWSDDGEMMAFQSTRRNDRSNDVWLMDPDEPGSARMIVESPDGTWWGPMDWDREGRRLLIANYVSVTDSRMHLLDIESGQLTLLAGDPDSPISVLGAGADFAGDDRGVFFATDEAGDFTQLAYLDLATGDKKIITVDIPWDVDGFVLSDDGTRGAFVVNEGGVHRPYLFDPASHEYRRVENIPVGLIFGSSFSPDGTRLAMTLNTANTPSDVFTLALGDDPLDSGELTRWTYSEVGGLDTETFVEPELIHYPTFDEREIPAFVYR
ncbi:MAG: S9 family peptidase, partial [Acidobacteriota bacterium]|nr:S9 family peptidase [Acidobacteriota bacterium]